MLQGQEVVHDKRDTHLFDLRFCGRVVRAPKIRGVSLEIALAARRMLAVVGVNT